MTSRPAFNGTPNSMDHMPSRKHYDPTWTTPSPSSTASTVYNESEGDDEYDFDADLRGATTEEMFGPTAPTFDFDVFDSSSIATAPDFDPREGGAGRDGYETVGSNENDMRGPGKAQASTACSDFARSGSGRSADNSSAFDVPGHDIWGERKRQSKVKNGPRNQRAYSLKVEECNSSVEGLHIGASECEVISPCSSTVILRRNGRVRSALEAVTKNPHPLIILHLPGLKSPYTERSFCCSQCRLKCPSKDCTKAVSTRLSQ